MYALVPTSSDPIGKIKTVVTAAATTVLSICPGFCGARKVWQSGDCDICANTVPGMVWSIPGTVLFYLQHDCIAVQFRDAYQTLLHIVKSIVFLELVLIMFIRIIRVIMIFSAV